MNAIRCNFCGMVIESKHRHDFVAHRCEAMTAKYGPSAMIAVDGGSAYKKRIYNELGDYTEVSETERAS